MTHVRRALAIVALLLIALMPEVSSAADRPTLQAPRRVLTGEAATLTGTAPTSSVRVQEASSASGPWRTTVKVPVRSGRFRAVVAPESTTYYRIAARSTFSQVRRVSVVDDPDPVYVWRSLRSLGTVGGSAAPAFEDEYQVRLGGTTSDATGDSSNVVATLRPASPSGFVEIGTAASCDRARMRIGLDSPYSGAPATIRVLLDGVAAVDRTFGVDQVQNLDLDVTGVRVLRIEATRGSSSSTTATYPTAADVSLHCDQRLGRRLPDTTAARWSELPARGSVDGSPDPAFGDQYSVQLGGVEYDGNNLEAKLTASAPSAFVVFDLGRACRRLRVSLGMSSPYSQDAGRLRILADGRTLFSRDIGVDQRQDLDLDVSGVDELRLDATRLTSEGSGFAAIADPQIYCRR